MSDSASFGFERVPLEDKQGLVDDVFHSVAARYDLMNDLMSGGLHRVWKSAMVSALNPPRRGRPWHMLDVAGGTGDIALRVAERSNGHASIVVSDINPSMLDIGQERAEASGFGTVSFREANAESLPFETGRFDAYTIAFGIRNVPRIEAALAEAYRVLKRGGRFFCLEFSTTLWPGFAEIYDSYSHKIVPKVGKLLAHDEDSYRYLIESIRRFPDMPTFERMIGEAGFIRTRVEPMLGGLVAIHSGWKI